MANKVVDILLRASDQFSDTTKKAELQFAALKIQADNVNKSFEKLSDQHPDLSANEARAAAVALESMASSAKHGETSFKDANEAARGFGELVGVRLPRFVTSFISETAAIGPVLSGAFSTIAIIGLIEALDQIPVVFEKMTGAVTGWNKEAQKAYSEFIDSNNKARLAALDLNLAVQSAFGDTTASNLETVNKALAEQQRLILSIEAELRAAKDLESRSGIELNAILALRGDRSTVEIQESLNHAREYENELIKRHNDLLKQSTIEDTQNQQEFLKWMLETDAKVIEFKKKQAEEAAKMQAEFDKLVMSLRSVLTSIEQIGANDAWKATLRANQELQDEVETTARLIAGKIIDDFQIAREAQEQFRKDSIRVQDEIDNALRLTTKVRVEEILKARAEDERNWKEQIDANIRHAEQAINSIKESAGKIFDDMFIKGQSVFSSLQNAIKGGVLSLGRALFEDIVGTLFGPIKQAFDDFFKRVLQGLISGFAKNLGESISGALGGASSGGGGGGLFGGLLGFLGPIGLAIGGGFAAGSLIGKLFGGGNKNENPTPTLPAPAPIAPGIGPGPNSGPGPLPTYGEGGVKVTINVMGSVVGVPDLAQEMVKQVYALTRDSSMFAVGAR